MSRLLDLPGPPEWTGRAACTAADADLFFPGRGERADAAKAICRPCTVRICCLGYVLARPAEGVWAGFTERTRRRVAVVHAAGRSLADIIAASDAAADALHDAGLARAAGTSAERKRARDRIRGAAARAAAREARTSQEAA